MREAYVHSRRELQVEPAALAAVEDRTITGPGGPLPLRIYRPLQGKQAGPLPCLLYAHGGGFVLGNLESHDPLCRSLAAQGQCAVVAVDYRLAPETPFPGAAEDAYAAARWPDDLVIGMGLGNSRMATGDVAGAMQAFEQVAQRHDSAAAWNNLALLRWQLGQAGAAREAARRAWQRALQAEPAFQPAVRDTLGRNTTELPSGNWQISPRVGFNWDALSNGTTQVRGGTGLFTGRPAYVWISNQLGNTGVLIGENINLSPGTAFPFQLRRCMTSYPRVLRVPPVAWTCQTIMSIYVMKLHHSFQLTVLTL